MALEGICEIELKDTCGNTIMKTEDKNMITNGLSRFVNIDTNKLMKILGYNFTTEHINRCTPLIQKLIGGCILFNKQNIEEADNIIPNPFSIVAGGSLSKLTLNDQRIGNWNINESIPIYNESGKITGFKFVWDFPTDRGNGTIKSISLTTDIGGRCLMKNVPHGHGYVKSLSDSKGPGLPFNLINPVSEKTIGNQTDIDTKGDYMSNTYLFKSGLLGSAYENEVVVISSASYSSKSMVIEKYILNNAIKLNDKCCNIGTSDYKICSSYELAGSITVDITDFFKAISDKNTVLGIMNGQTYLYNGYIYVTYGYGDKIIIKKIDAKTLEVVENIEKTYTGTGINVFYWYSRTYSPSPIYVYKDYYIFMYKDVDTTKILITNKDNLSIVKEIPVYANNDEFRISGGLLAGYFNDMIFISCDFQNADGKNTQQFIKLIDADLNIIDTGYIFGGYPVQFAGVDYPFIFSKPISRAIMGSEGYYIRDYESTGCIISGNVLFTIDNLKTPVTKTASQTMKVIYTIQDTE